VPVADEYWFAVMSRMWRTFSSSLTAAKSVPTPTCSMPVRFAMWRTCATKFSRVGGCAGSLSQFIRPWMLAPTTPPVAATAFSVSSVLLRGRGFTDFALAWVSSTGRFESRAASVAVASEQCDRSMATPTLLSSPTSSRPNRLNPPLRGSEQPSPTKLASL